jgi:hypothetical protein
MDPSSRKKTFDSNGLMDHSIGLYCGKNADDNSFTDLSHTANSYPSYLLVVLQNIDSLKENEEDLLS